MLLKQLSIGIDVGATKIECAMVDDQGNILKRLNMKSWEFPSLQENVDHLFALVDHLLVLFGRENVHYIGMGLPGTVDDQLGLVKYTPNLQWIDLPIAQMLRKHTNLPVHLVQDTAAAAWGEYLYGAGKGKKNIVCATIGSGVACGIIIDGKLYGGKNHTAGEIGHLHVEDDELVCGCGNKGCLEAHASGFGLVKMFQYGIQHGEQSALVLQCPSELIDAHAIFDAARSGDPFCQKIVDKMARYLARGFSAVATVLAPETFIISGGLSRETELLWIPLKKYFYNYAYRSVRENVELLLAKLGKDAPVIGAASLYQSAEYAEKP